MLKNSQQFMPTVCPRGGGARCPVPKCGRHAVASLQHRSRGRTILSGAADPHDLSWMIKVNINSDGFMSVEHTLDTMQRRRDFISGFPPESCNSSLMIRKTTKPIPMRDVLHSARWALLTHVTVIKTKESLRNGHSQEELRSHDTKCSVVSWMGS